MPHFRNLSSVMELATSIFNKFSEVLGNPYIVNEVFASEYDKRILIDQNGQLRLYSDDQYIDCILIHPTRKEMLIRMFRMSTLQMPVAKVAFRCLSTHMQNFYSNITEWYTPNRLTSLSGVMRRFESWSSVHIAIEAGLSEVLTPAQVGYMINNQFCDKARSPMHLACDKDRLDLLEKCVMIGGDLGLQDENGDTVLHYVITKSNKDFVKFVCEKLPKEKLDTQNSIGETALHIACKKNKMDICKILVDAGASINKCSSIGYPLHYTLKHADQKFSEYILSKDPTQVSAICSKHKSLPIFWCRTGEDVILLLKHNSKVVFTSATGDTPLHVMVLKDRLDAAIGLIFSHADINVKGTDGNTPLHLAVTNDNIRLVKMLLLYGADCKASNDFNETPGLLAMRNKKTNKDDIIELLSSVGGIHLDSTESQTPSSSHHSLETESLPKSKVRRAKILCLDGGGIRGLVLAQILIAIEEETGKKSSELFDWIGGTSTGGLLALALSLGLKAADCQGIYFRLKDKVFSGSRPYNSDPIESFLKSIFGETTTMATLQSKPKIVLTSVLANQRPAKLHLFRNYEAIHELAPSNKITAEKKKKVLERSGGSICIDDIMLSPMDTPLWQVARSSGAAPTYFRPMENFVDGGIMSNNPTLDMLTEIHRYNKALRNTDHADEIKPPGVMISLGTGIIPAVKVDSVDIVRSSNPLHILNAAYASMELTQIMIDAICECNAHINNRAEAWCESIDVPYFRLNPDLKNEIAMNETSDEKLVDMLWTTKLYLQKNKHLIQEISHLLLSDE